MPRIEAELLRQPQEPDIARKKLVAAVPLHDDVFRVPLGFEMLIVANQSIFWIPIAVQKLRHP